MPTRLQTNLGAVVDAVFDGSTEAAAEAAELPSTTLASILDGEMPSPHPEIVGKLAREYGVPHGWLDGSDPAADPPTDEAPLWLILLRAYWTNRIRPDREWMAAVRGAEEFGTIQELIDSQERACFARFWVFRQLVSLAQQRYGELPDSYRPLYRLELETLAHSFHIVVTELKKLEGSGKLVSKRRQSREGKPPWWDAEYRVWIK
ncbi:hypothetical protein ACFL6C_03150 [Myxococcota bacterium]